MDPTTVAPPLIDPDVHATQPPRVLVQWLPTERLRRQTRLQSGSTGQSGDVRQVGVNYDHPRYAEAAAIATIPVSGPHASQFLLLVGWRGEATLSPGGWTLGGGTPRTPAGRDTVYRFATEPTVDDLIDAALVEWAAEHPGAEGEQLLADLVGDVRERLTSYRQQYEAMVRQQVARQKLSPLSNPEAFDRVAGTAEVVADLRKEQIAPFAEEVRTAVRANPERARDGAMALDQVVRAAVSWDAAAPAVAVLTEEGLLEVLGYGNDGARYTEERRRLWDPLPATSA